MSLPLTVLGGFDEDAVADVAAGLLVTTPRLAAVHVDPFTAELGFVQARITDSDGRCTDTVVPLEHHCLTCTMRHALARIVRELAGTARYDAVVVRLAPGVDSASTVRGLGLDLAGTARVDTVAGVVHGGWLDDLGGDADAMTRGIALTDADDRSAAMILAALLDLSSVLVLPGSVGDDLTIEEHAALSVLCPDAMRLFPETGLDVPSTAVLATGSFDPRTRTLFSRRALLDPHLHLPAVSGSLELVRWTSDGRPLHPRRLRDVLDRVADGVIRSAGHVYVASHPDTAVHWYSAGDCLTLGPAAAWPDAKRRSMIAFVGEALDAEHLRRELDACLLTDAEFAGGRPGWANLENPFVEWRDADAATADDDTDEDVA